MGQLTSVHQEYGTSQSNTTLFTPASGKVCYVWNLIVTATGDYKIEFPDSGVVMEGSGGTTGSYLLNKQGNANELLKVTCAADTIIDALVDEI